MVVHVDHETPRITTLLWDVGGVLLTNAWDRVARRRAATAFGIDLSAFEARHAAVVQEFECGRLSMNAYLACTVFDEPRGFSQERFMRFMYAQSEAYPDSLQVLDRVANRARHRIVMFNNESCELNRYRIDRFALASRFDLFFSSCFVGLRKPDERFYRLALDLLQAKAEHCLLIDDRAGNLEPASRLGIQTIGYHNASQLADDLASALVLSS